MELFNPYNNINLWIKHTFLSFAQGYFSLNSKFTWVSDPKTTKLIIADKFAVDLGVIEKRPAIILSRGSFGWSDFVRGQDGINAPLSNKRVDTLAPAPSGDRWLDFVFTDWLRGSVTFNVLSKNGIEAEEIANILFVALSGYKRELQAYGIHSVKGLTIGDERLVKTTSEIEAMGITVSLSFTAQRTIEKAGKLNNIVAVMHLPKETTTGTTTEERSLYENINYRIINNGTTVEFLNPPPADTIEINLSFVDAVTLDTVTSPLIGDYDDDNRTYTVSGGTVYGYYVLSEGIIMSGMVSNTDEYGNIYTTTSGLTDTGAPAVEEPFASIYTN